MPSRKTRWSTDTPFSTHSRGVRWIMVRGMNVPHLTHICSFIFGIGRLQTLVVGPNVYIVLRFKYWNRIRGSGWAVLDWEVRQLQTSFLQLPFATTLTRAGLDLQGKTVRIYRHLLADRHLQIRIPHLHPHTVQYNHRADYKVREHRHSFEFPFWLSALSVVALICVFTVRRSLLDLPFWLTSESLKFHPLQFAAMPTNYVWIAFFWIIGKC